MCLLTVFPEGVYPDTARLYRGALFNGDGHGWAIVRPGREILVGKSLDEAEAIDGFDEARKRYPEGPALFHSRFATHGEVGVDNVHPFAVAGNPRTVLAHNGILPANVQPRKGDPRSDTRIAASWFIPNHLGKLSSRRARKRVEKWMGHYNKIAVLSVDPSFREPLYILNESAGIWDDGIWYSNDGYLPYHQKTTWKAWNPVYGSTAVRAEIGAGLNATEPDGLVRCSRCEAIVDHRVLDECPFCGQCFDCGEAQVTCQCWSPPGTVRSADDMAEANARSVALWGANESLEEFLARNEARFKEESELSADEETLQAFIDRNIDEYEAEMRAADEAARTAAGQRQGATP